MLKKSKFLIAAWPDDLHALAVAFLLRERGAQVDFFRSSDYPTRSYISDYISPEKVRIEVETVDGLMVDSEYTTVWWRRYTGFYSSRNLHPDDYALVKLENKVYTRHFPTIFASAARWVNQVDGEMNCSNKQLQLRMALKVGLAIPDTLVTNSRERAEAFIGSANALGKAVVFKTILPHDWITGDVGSNRGVSSYTTEITTKDLADDDVFRAFAGILQHKCESVFEVRAVFMGSACVAMEYNHKGSVGRTLDSRLVPRTPGQAKRHFLPPSIHEKCTHLMGRLGLVFACIDLLVLGSGEYVFLEANPQGQWLWMEEFCPEIKVLEPFTAFLYDGCAEDHSFTRVKGDTTYASIRSSVQKMARKHEPL